MPTTQWFRAASQVGKNLPPSKGGCPPGQPFPLLICRHSLRFHLSTGPPLPLYAGTERHRPSGSGQSGVPLSLHRSLAALHKPSSLEDDQRHFIVIVSGGLMLLSSMTRIEASAAFSISVLTISPYNKVNLAAGHYRNLHFGFVSDGVHRCAIGSDFRGAEPPPPLASNRAFSVFWGRTASGRR